MIKAYWDHDIERDIDRDQHCDPLEQFLTHFYFQLAAVCVLIAIIWGIVWLATNPLPERVKELLEAILR